MDPRIFISVVTFNSEDFIENCIDSIIASDRNDWFLTVIDNNSGDSTVDRIHEKYKSSKILDKNNFSLIELKKNIGFSGAVNHTVFRSLLKKQQELKKVENGKDNYLLLINPDLTVNRDTISNLLKVIMSKDIPVGAAGGLVYEYDGNVIQNAGGRIEKNFITTHLLQASGGLYKVDYVSGSLFMMKLELFIRLGGFDSGYRPVYFEELDLCLKLKKLGQYPYIATNAVARHFEGASIVKFSRRFYKYYHKNRIRCAVINYSFFDFLKYFLLSESKWIRISATEGQLFAILYGYFLNFFFLPYNLSIKLLNLKRIRAIKKKAIDH